MKTKSMFYLTLFTVIFGTGILVAQEGLVSGFSINQDGPGPPDPATIAQHRVQMLTKVLSLTSDQQKQALTIFTEVETSVSALHDSMKTAHDALATAVKSNDADGISQAATTIGNLTAQMTAAEAKGDAALYATLTADQQAKFGQFESRHVFFTGADAMYFHVAGPMVPGGPPNN